MSLERPEVPICPLTKAIHLVSGKWSVPVLCVLAGHEAIRYNDLRRKVGDITNIMLTQTLKDFSDNGIVERIQYNEIPPRVEYELTEKGRAFAKALFGLVEWVSDYEDSSLMAESCKACHSR